ncbi:hypothetical protein pdam_00016563, partial [Pocillopora damicornis]
IQSCPHICGASCPEGFCFVASSQVIMFDASCNDILATFNFECEIDCIAWSEDSLFLAIGERSAASMQLILSDSSFALSVTVASFQQALVFTPMEDKTRELESDGNLKCSEECTFLSMLFTTPKCEGGCKLVILSASGMITQFSNLYLQKLNDGLLQVESVDAGVVHQEKISGITVGQLWDSPVYITYGEGDAAIAVWASCREDGIYLMDSISSYILGGSCVVKANMSSDGHFLVVLDDKNMLSLWNVSSLTMIAFWPHLSIDDFLLLSSSNIQTPGMSKSDDEYKLVVLTTAENQMRYLQVYTFPTMKSVYSLQVSACSLLAQCPTNQESIFFIEGIYQNPHERTNDDRHISSIRIRSLTEALPENRLSRLLHKQKFDEALRFAKQFNLDIEISSNSGVHSQKEGPCGKPSRLLTEVLEALDRLATFEMAFGVENFSGPQWQYFASVDLLVELTKCLLSSKVTSAVIIWRRHQSHFVTQFSMEKLESLIGSIPEDLHSSIVIPWLQDDLVPFISKAFPSGLRMLASWLEQRAKNMELSEKEGWPQNALQLASVLLCASKSVSGSASGRGLATPAQFSDQDVDDELASLMKLVQQLTELVDLHTKYSCKITLAEFSQETIATIVFRLLDRVVAAELIPSAIAKYIAPYMVHHSLDRDTMLLRYIEDLFNRSDGSYSSLSNSLWEARVIAIISCIKEKEVRCKATLEVMRHAMIPWSESVEKLVSEFMAAYPKLVELKKMLSQYRIRSFHVSYAARAKAITRYILTRDQPNVMEDALKVVTSYSHVTEDEAYVFRLQKLCREDKIPACLELLESVPLPQAEQYAHELVTWLSGILENNFSDTKEFSSEKIVAAQAGVAILKFMKKHNLSSIVDVDESLSTLQMISALQREFSVFLSVEEYQVPDVRHGLFEQYLQLYLDSREKKDSDVYEKHDSQKISSEVCSGVEQVTLTKLFRLGELVGMLKEEIRLTLMSKAISAGNISYALDMCRELIERAPCARTALTLYKVVLNLCETLAEGHSIVTDKNENMYHLTHTIHQLLCQASTHCSADLLCDCAELCKYCRLTDSVYSQCESGDYGFSVQTTPQSSSQDPFMEWTFGKRFREDCLVLDSFVALPLAAKLSIAAVPANYNSAGQRPFYQARVAGRRQKCQESKATESGEVDKQSSYLMLTSSAGLGIIRHLQDNSLCELALQYLLQTLGVCLQHFAVNSMLSNDKENQKSGEIEKQRLAKIATMSIKMMQELSGNLLRKVFNYRSVDHDVGLGYLCSIPKQTAFQILVSGTNFLGQSCTKILAFSKVGMDYAQLCNEPAMSLKDVYKTDREEKLAILPDLMQKQQISLEMILEFCRAFKLDEDSALLTYVRQQLLPPSPRSPLVVSQDGVEEMNYQRNVRKVVHKISCSSSLLKLMVEVGSKVDPYDYDTILFILNLVKELSQETASTVDKGIQLLDYLYQYERKAVPTSYERSFYSSSQNTDSEKATLDNDKPLSVMSRTRLPYHSLLYGNPWKILAPELSEETVPKLLGIANLLKLSSDEMYLTAIRNLARSSVGPAVPCDLDGDPNISGLNVNEGPSQLVKNYNSEKAKSMLYAVNNKEMAIAAAKWIAQNLPLGEEKIDMLKTCVDLAKTWKSECSEKDEEKAKLTHSRLLELCRGVATEHVLHKYNIVDPSIASLTSKPAKLVCQLYEKYGAREPGTAHLPPDIHKTAEEVASVNNTKIEKIRLYLIEKWLPSSAETSGDTELITPVSEENEEDEQNLKRVIYIMESSSDRPTTVTFLLNLANKTGSSSTCRLRALRTLFAIAPGEFIEKLCKTSVSVIRQQMQALVCLAELEGLHIQQSASAFDKCNKEGLVRGLWRNHKHERKAVRLVADLCLDNNINDPQLWNSVLQQLLAFGMIKYLRRVLVNLAGISDLWQVRCLPQVWRSVLTAPFKSVSTPLSEEEVAACEESASLLQRCPILLDLDVYSIAVQFHKVGLQAHSLACLLLIPSSSAREKHIQALLETNCVNVILAQLDEQRQRGSTLIQPDAVEQEVFKYVEQKQEYQILLGTAYFDKLLKFLIMGKNINGILLKTIQAGRLENAIQLVQLFHQAHLDMPSAQYITSHQMKGFDELWTFLEMHGMLDACLPFLPKLDADQKDDEPAGHQTQSFWVQEGEETIGQTMEQSAIDDQRDHFMLTLTDCSMEVPL